VVGTGEEIEICYLYKMRLIVISILLACTPFFSFSQNRNSIWCFGDSAGIDFRDTINPVPYMSVMDGRGSCVSICDSMGAMQFYADTYTPLSIAYVWNANHDTLLNSDSIISAGGYNELQIVPFPGNKHKYYLFYTGWQVYYDGIYYSIIDMNLDQGLGAVVMKNIQINSNRIGDCLQAVKHANGRDWWLVSKLSNLNSPRQNRFFVYLITPDSISPEMAFDFNDATDLDFQKIIFNQENTKIMEINLRGYMCEYDFDRCTGIVNNPRLIYPEITTAPYNRLFWEGSYSPDGNLFYVSTSRWTGVNESYLIQYDLNSIDIPNSADTIDITYPPIGSGAVRLAPDDKIYYSRAYESPTTNSFPYADSMYNYINMNLSVINNPNGIGTSCDFQPFSFYLGGKRTYYGLPNNPKYDLGPVVGSACDSLVNYVSPNIHNESQLLAFPNPFNKTIKIQMNDGLAGKIKIYNAVGELVYFKLFTASNEIDLSFLPIGTYQLEFINEKNVLRKKIVKMN